MTVLRPAHVNMFFGASMQEDAVKSIGSADYHFYNSLPFVNDAADVAKALQCVRTELASIIESHDLAQLLSIRLIHKHFDMLPGEVATFKTVAIPNICEAIVMGPFKPVKDEHLYGKNFAIDGNGNLTPYEMTTDARCGGDVNDYPEFAREASEFLVKSGATKVFGLSWEPIEDSTEFTEFEVPAKRTTIMVPSRIFPSSEMDEVINTNWFVSDVSAASTVCTITRSGRHYGCSSTRTGKHYGVRSLDETASEPLDDSPFFMAMQDPGSDLLRIVDYVISGI